MKFWLRRPSQTGDTIVEVLIAVAIVSTVLAGAFLVAQKSTLAVRDSQEHAEVTQLLQGQVELVRSLALAQSDDTTGVFKTSPKYFCINGSNPTSPTRVDFSAGYSLPADANDTYNGYPAACAGIDGRYNIAISYDAATKAFTVMGRWDSVGGGKNQEQFSYRIYPGM